jgi:hypothetical protein
MTHIQRSQAVIFAVNVTLATVIAPQVAATPAGLLRIDSGSGGVAISATTIDWYAPIGPPFGAFLVGSGTTLTSSGGSPIAGTSGVLLDLNAATTPLPVRGFLTLTAYPALIFDLTQLGPGVANTICSGLAIGESCSPGAGSPFILTRTGTGVLVSLSVAGIARDGTFPEANWLGTFTTQVVRLGTITAPTPHDIQTFFLGNENAVISSTYSAEIMVEGTQPPPNPQPQPLASFTATGCSLVGYGGTYTGRAALVKTPSGRIHGNCHAKLTSGNPVPETLNTSLMAETPFGLVSCEVLLTPSGGASLTCHR